MHPFYVMRFFGGVFFLGGMLLMAYNVWKTIADVKPVTVAIPATAH